MNNGLQNQQHKNLELRKFITETSSEFYEWMQEDENIPLDTRLINQQSYNKFIEEYPDFKKFLQVRKFKNWIRKYCELKGYFYGDGVAMNQRYFYISKQANPDIPIPEDRPF